MNKKHLFLSVVFIVLITMILAACGGGKNTEPEKEEGNGDNVSSGNDGNEEKNYGIEFLSLATGGTGGTYYPLGGSMASIIQDATGIDANATTSNASAENMTLLKKKEVEVAFTQTDIATYANEGTMMFEGEKIENVRGLGTLYPETIQIVTIADTGINSVEDLKGKAVSIGEAGSGTRANAEQILEMYGMTVDDIKARNLSFDDSSTGIQDGTIDAAFITAGTPTGAVEGLAATKDVKILPLDNDKIEALIEKYPYYAKETIPAGTYKAENDIETVAVQAMLVVREDLSEDLVYDITKAIFENTDKIGHAKSELIDAEKALNGMGIEIHPGAKKYYDEKGISKE
ncbi:TAXI family TRAP transporter solute-binding subunit [Bacillus niameyensis]|uniref:TAXI family TRAP transporter solute-binding subunit n=1 Tax=Bacillus niameyensis TaxID=1522308 RepID=UPI0007860E3B|nr:TAXI family TRAP transporter solute-binding subunit [Bacillus niameyensis]